jgi:hypothetical protein
MYNFAHIKKPINTGSGVAEKVFIAPVDWFAADGIKSPGDWLQIGDKVTIQDDHVFLSGKAFFELALAPEKNSYTAKAIGDNGFIQFANELKINLPGSYDLQHEFIKNILNSPCIVIIKDANCPANIYYQIGNACAYAYLSADFETGTTKEGSKNYLLTVKNSASSVLIYAGDLLTLDELQATGNIILTEDGNNILTEDGQDFIMEQ